MDEILKKDKKINKVFEKSGVNQDRLKGVFTDNKKEAITKRDQKKFGSEIKFSYKNKNKVKNKELLDLDFPDITPELLKLDINFDDIDLPDITTSFLDLDINFDEVNIPEITSAFLNFKNDFQDIKIPDITKEFLQLDINFDDVEIPEITKDFLDIDIKEKKHRKKKE